MAQKSQVGFLTGAALFFGVTAALPAAVKTEPVKYRSGAKTVEGFLALPGSAGKHPALVVIHEWWGLTPWVKGQAQKLAAQGYVALAVDLYHGKVTTDPSQASVFMRGLNHTRALQDLEAAFQYLASRPDVESNKIGSIGWCMGGGWSLQLAAREPKLAACVVNYGELLNASEIRKIHAPVLGNFGAKDGGIPPRAVDAFEAAMRRAGKQVNIKIYPGAGHAFENPNNRGGYRPAAARNAWQRTLTFLNATLAG
ncbi:MAG: dienelactone hydrolase family protein [Terriglobia bacterium]